MPTDARREQNRLANARYRAKHPERAKASRQKYAAARPEVAEDYAERNKASKAARMKTYDADPDRRLIKKRKAAGILNPTAERRSGECPVCGRLGALVCDHDHSTGIVRGWICSKCNRGLGLLGDSLKSTEGAAEYLRGFYATQK